MFQYVMRRTLLAILVLLGSSVAIFVLSRVMPADPVRMAVGLNADRETVERYRHEWGLDKPLPEQYLLYMQGALQGDFGKSLRSQQPVSHDIQRYYPATLELALVSMILYMAVGLVLGSIAGMTNRTGTDTGIRLLALGAYSIPPFWLGLVLQILFYANLRALPALARIDSSVIPPANITGLYLVDSLLMGNVQAFGNSLQHLVLPATTIVLSQAGLMVRMLRVSVLDVKERMYVTTARAKGLREWLVYRRHVLRNALLPVLTMAGIQFGWLLTGTIVVESIFAWPGLGRYAVDSILSADYAPVMAVALLATAVFVILNLLVDLLYSLVDPRISYRS